MAFKFFLTFQTTQIWHFCQLSFPLFPLLNLWKLVISLMENGI